MPMRDLDLTAEGEGFAPSPLTPSDLSEATDTALRHIAERLATARHRLRKPDATKT